MLVYGFFCMFIFMCAAMSAEVWREGREGRDEENCWRHVGRGGCVREADVLISESASIH